MEPIDNPNKGIARLTETQKTEGQKDKPKVEQKPPGLKRSTSVEDMQEKLNLNLSGKNLSESLADLEAQDKALVKSTQNLSLLDQAKAYVSNLDLLSFGIDQDNPDLTLQLDVKPQGIGWFSSTTIHGNPIAKKSLLSSRHVSDEALTTSFAETTKDIHSKYGAGMLAGFKGSTKSLTHSVTGSLLKVTSNADKRRKELTDRLSYSPVLVHVLKLRGDDNQRASFVEISKLGDSKNQAMREKLQGAFGDRITHDMDVYQTVSGEFFVKSPGKDEKSPLFFLARVGNEHRIIDLKIVEQEFEKVSQESGLKVSDAVKYHVDLTRSLKESYVPSTDSERNMELMVKHEAHLRERKNKLESDIQLFSEKIVTIVSNIQNVRSEIDKIGEKMKAPERKALGELLTELGMAKFFYERNLSYAQAQFLAADNDLKAISEIKADLDNMLQSAAIVENFVVTRANDTQLAAMKQLAVSKLKESQTAFLTRSQAGGLTFKEEGVMQEDERRLQSIDRELLKRSRAGVSEPEPSAVTQPMATAPSQADIFSGNPMASLMKVPAAKEPLQPMPEVMGSAPPPPPMPGGAGGPPPPPMPGKAPPRLPPGSKKAEGAAPPPPAPKTPMQENYIIKEHRDQFEEMEKHMFLKILEDIKPGIFKAKKPDQVWVEFRTKGDKQVKSMMSFLEVSPSACTGESILQHFATIATSNLHFTTMVLRISSQILGQQFVDLGDDQKKQIMGSVNTFRTDLQKAGAEMVQKIVAEGPSKKAASIAAPKAAPKGAAKPAPKYSSPQEEMEAKLAAKAKAQAQEKPAEKEVEEAPKKPTADALILDFLKSQKKEEEKKK